MSESYLLEDLEIPTASPLPRAQQEEEFLGVLQLLE